MQKIMFNDRLGLTDAVLEGRKTMTRRIIGVNADNAFWHWNLVNRLWRVIFSIRGKQAELSRYARGEVVAIAQRYCDIVKGDGMPKGMESGWRNKMFVKAEEMQHHIKITDIKVERLQDITEDECLREGVQRLERGYVYKGMPESIDEYPTARDAFAALIDKVSGKGTWASDPIVFAYSFELVD